MRIRFPRPVYDANAADAGAGGGGDQKPVMPEGLPADFWDAEKGEVKFADIGTKFGELSTLKTEHDARLAAVPAKPEDYKFALPEGFKVPDGLEFQIDEKDPAFGALRAFAHEHKLPQAAVSALLAIEAQRQAVDLNAAVEQTLAEEKALGANFPERKAAVEAFLRSNVEQAEYEALRSVVTSAKAFAAIEKLIEKATAGGIPSGGGGGETAKTAAQVLYPSMTRKAD